MPNLFAPLNKILYTSLLYIIYEISYFNGSNIFQTIMNKKIDIKFFFMINLIGSHNSKRPNIGVHFLEEIAMSNLTDVV